VVPILLALAVAAPPRATITTVAKPTPLAVSSWCWKTHCGAPISASRKTVVARRGSLVRVDFAYAPTQVRVAIAGKPVTVSVRGHEATWTARAGGGMSIDAIGSGGWVIYVARLRLTGP
jgi:hypothetical protein